jgi:hypothetical protein
MPWLCIWLSYLQISILQGPSLYLLVQWGEPKFKGWHRATRFTTGSLPSSPSSDIQNREGKNLLTLEDKMRSLGSKLTNISVSLTSQPRLSIVRWSQDHVAIRKLVRWHWNSASEVFHKHGEQTQSVSQSWPPGAAALAVF